MLRQGHLRAHTDTHDDQIGTYLLARRERDCLLHDSRDRGTKMKDHPVQLINRAHHIADRSTQDALHGACFRRNSMDLQAASPQ